MGTIKELFEIHSMQGEASCVAWGFEFIAKYRNQLDWDKFPIQHDHPSGLGFSQQDRDEFEKTFHIKTEQKSVLIDELWIFIQDEIKRGNPPLVCLFSQLKILFGTKSYEFVRGFHVFVGMEEDGEVFLLGRTQQSSEIVLLSFSRVKEIHGWSAALPKHPPAIDCLVHI